MVHTNPGLPPIAESSPEAQDPGRCGNVREDRQEVSSKIVIVKSFVEDKQINAKKRPLGAQILKKV
jgi:hypothetical protein